MNICLRCAAERVDPLAKCLTCGVKAGVVRADSQEEADAWREAIVEANKVGTTEGTEGTGSSSEGRC